VIVPAFICPGPAGGVGNGPPEFLGHREAKMTVYFLYRFLYISGQIFVADYEMVFRRRGSKPLVGIGVEMFRHIEDKLLMGIRVYRIGEIVPAERKPAQTRRNHLLRLSKQIDDPCIRKLSKECVNTAGMGGIFGEIVPPASGIEMPFDAVSVKLHNPPFPRGRDNFVEAVEPGIVHRGREEKPDKQAVPDIEKQTFIFFRFVYADPVDLYLL